jgi:cyclopropane fatty-acyl-phospholipid synthase-like methyltransferase
MAYTFDEFREQTIDFQDPEVVAQYDRKQDTALPEERMLAESLEVEPDQVVIEFGPGTGAFCIAAAERRARVHAVDTSSAMLSFLESCLSEEETEHLTTHHGGFLTYEHSGPPADLVVTKFALHHLPDFWKTVALTRIHDMLKPTGRLYIRDVVFSFRPALYKQAIDRWIEQMTAGGGWTREEFETHVNEEYSTFSWVLEDMLRNTGFRLLKLHYWSDTYGTLLAQKDHHPPARNDPSGGRPDGRARTLSGGSHTIRADEKPARGSPRACSCRTRGPG